MSNNQYKDNELNRFIKEFSGKFDLFEGSLRAVESQFNNRYFRVTRYQILNDIETEMLKLKLGKKIGEYEVLVLPIKTYPGHYKATVDLFVGIYDDINDLLENCVIDGVQFKDIVTSPKTTFLGTD